ncbi:hypothetical protein Q3H59_004248 [Pantoea sp. SORGH_AS 659]|nr:hypothetical protein [Pantoea sp. SORGH_AS_0659]
MKVWIAITLTAAVSCSVWASQGGFDYVTALNAAQAAQQK